MRLLDTRVASVEIDVHVVDLAAGGCEIVEALVLVAEVFHGQHVDGADEPSFAIIGEERTGRQGLRIHIELTESREEVGQLDEFAYLLVGARWRSLLDLVGGEGRQAEGGSQSECGDSSSHDILHWCA
jgi:hypothetical protein